MINIHMKDLKDHDFFQNFLDKINQYLDKV